MFFPVVVSSSSSSPFFDVVVFSSLSPLVVDSFSSSVVSAFLVSVSFSVSFSVAFSDVSSSSSEEPLAPGVGVGICGFGSAAKCQSLRLDVVCVCCRRKNKHTSSG